MEALLQFAGNYWWLVFPLGGVIGGAARGISAANERRAQRRLERYRIKQETKVALAREKAAGQSTAEGRRRELTKVLERHDATDARWLSYEMDVAKLLDFPVMTDMREPLTLAFHKAKSRADLLRPAHPNDLVGDRDAAAGYRDAVGDYVAAFDAAEAEATRRRRSDFSADDQDRLARAQHLLRLAADDAATPQERQNAYGRAQKELAGLLVLPVATRAAIERKVLGELEA
ncbi:hypothetical protein EUA04_23080 [Mycolicibacterium obuense]|uniref:Uncharacterized protein n=1 Tax=Mycolicibacterium obuense TaxID=1807 RepID=A0A0J6VZG0_9MYCO|nr:hypothetical protein [Mycolicibacterium obuense]KMO74817.1 hypothetical protein MOBUDSM44075_03347 [Mycolicibacterium obuense]TDL04648.1 hypothetical protein EUA04_23080 [Mycolicibacterium obuense]